MTVCIAALCDEGSSAVVAADRMAVFGSGSILEFKLDDHGAKIHRLADRAVLLHSGRAQDAELICMKATGSDDADDLVDAVDKSVMALLEERRNVQVSRRLGKDFDFQKLVTSVGNAPSGPLYELLHQVGKTDLGDMLIVAKKSERYEIHFHCPPALPSRADLHYQAVGSGGIYARAALTIQQYTSDATVAEALFQVYSAKKAAELVYGVGEPTDMAILTREGIVDVSSETLVLLEEYRLEKAKVMLGGEQIGRLNELIGVE